MKKYIFLILVFVYSMNTVGACPPPGQDYQTWLNEFSTMVLKFGIHPQTLQRFQQEVTYSQSVANLTTKQPEFQLQPWEYMDRTLSAERIEQGHIRLKDYEPDLADLQLGVASEYLVAIWGLESNYGAFMGEYNVLQALSTLSFIGHRSTLRCREMLFALYMLDWGWLNWENMNGSWGGAIGHTQFLPSSLVRFGQDLNGDGRVEVWSEDPLEALASTAFYLLWHGWITDLDWGFEVSVPGGLDWYEAMTDKRSFEDWQKLGVHRRDGKKSPTIHQKDFRFVAPSGHRGPIFLVSENFDALLRYNSSTYYALSVGLLADVLKQHENIHLSLSWPRYERKLSLEERFELQNLLNQFGYDVQGLDGIIGRATRQAIRKYQNDHSMIADGFASSRLLEHLRAENLEK